MKIADILATQKRGVSFEFFPPRSAAGDKSLAVTVEKLKRYKPLYVSMTCGAGGSTQSKTQAAADRLLEAQGLEVMPHLTCVDATASSIKTILDGYKSKGIDNIMALRGDPPQGKSFDEVRGDFSYARDLVSFIKGYGHFSVGVAVYPEGHIETSSLDEDLEYTKRKVDAGADFAVTQMFFDNAHYFSLLERFAGKNIRIPVLPGILPLTDVEKIKQFASVCRATVPAHIEEAMQKHRAHPEEMEKVGLQFTVAQCRDLMKRGVERLHFFTFNNCRVISTLLDALDIRPDKRTI